MDLAVCHIIDAIHVKKKTFVPAYLVHSWITSVNQEPWKYNQGTWRVHEEVQLFGGEHIVVRCENEQHSFTFSLVNKAEFVAQWN